MRRVCSIFFYEGYVSLAPTIINLSKVLEQDGYSVTIFATRNSRKIPHPQTIADGAKVIYFSKIISSHEFLSHPASKKFIALTRCLQIFIFAAQAFIRILPKNYRVKETESNINIGVDLYGSIAALLWLYLFRQKFIYLSLELDRPIGKTGYITRLLSHLAELAYRKSEFVIVQDEDRLKTLCECYQYRHPQVFYLPNSPLNEYSPNVNSGNLFREMFNLSREKFSHIVLSAGMINDFVCSKALAEAFASIDNGCALVFHGVDFKGLQQEDPYLQLLRQVNSRNLFLSLNVLPYEQVDEIYASATIGVAFYSTADDNYIKIAKASGKLAQYLKHGKPVLVSNLPSLSQLVQKYKFGVIVNDPADPQELKLAIDKILRSYDTYSNNAKACFEAEFDFKKRMDPILFSINALQAVPELNFSQP